MYSNLKLGRTKCPWSLTNPPLRIGQGDRLLEQIPFHKLELSGYPKTNYCPIAQRGDSCFYIIYYYYLMLSETESNT